MCRWSGLLTAMLNLVHFINGRRVRGAKRLADGLEINPMLTEKRLVLFQAVIELSLVGTFLASARRLRGDHLAFYTGLDAIGTRLVPVATDFSLLAQDTTVAPG